MPKTFMAGRVTVDILEGAHHFAGVPTSQWHGDRQEQSGMGVLANLRANDGLRAQVALVTWPDGKEVSLRMADLIAGPADYERLEDAGELAPKLADAKLVARIRAMKYSGRRASLAAIDWDQLDAWSGQDARSTLTALGATRLGTYSELYPAATRFKTEPAIEVPVDNPAALFAVYALTRVMPIMTGFGRAAVEGPNA